MNPTQEQIKEFWEWCRFTFKPFAPQYEEPDELHTYFIYDPSGGLAELKEDPNTNLPFTDLNNLFKYVVPFLKDTCEEWWSVIVEWAKDITGNYEKDTLALFWALWKVKEQGKS